VPSLSGEATLSSATDQASVPSHTIHKGAKKADYGTKLVSLAIRHSSRKAPALSPCLTAGAPSPPLSALDALNAMGTLFPRGTPQSPALVLTHNDTIHRYGLASGSWCHIQCSRFADTRPSKNYRAPPFTTYYDTAGQLTSIPMKHNMLNDILRPAISPLHCENDQWPLHELISTWGTPSHSLLSTRETIPCTCPGRAALSGYARRTPFIS
jgi:hypothetical protein